MATDPLEILRARSAMPESAWAELDDIPARVPWQELRSRFVDALRQNFERWISRKQKHFMEQLIVAIGRFDEGVRLLSHLRRHVLPKSDLKVLDIGAGNGGVAFAFANDARNSVCTLDLVPNPQAASCRRLLGSPVLQMTGDGAQLPFATNSIDLVLLVDVLEHLERPRETAAEIMRVLRPGGVCFVATPARLSWVFRRDPHYGVRGLLLLPNDVQGFIVNRVLRRSIVSATGEAIGAYDVTHTYWHAQEIARLFPPPEPSMSFMTTGTVRPARSVVTG